jgi:hypothetical protein
MRTDFEGRVFLRKRLRQNQVADFFVNPPPCVVGLEACSGSYYWAWILSRSDHTVRLLAPQFVKPDVKSNKNDANNAEATCNAAGVLRCASCPRSQSSNKTFSHCIAWEVSRTGRGRQAHEIVWAELADDSLVRVSDLETQVVDLYPGCHVAVAVQLEGFAGLPAAVAHALVDVGPLCMLPDLPNEDPFRGASQKNVTKSEAPRLSCQSRARVRPRSTVKHHTGSRSAETTVVAADSGCDVATHRHLQGLLAPGAIRGLFTN